MMRAAGIRSLAVRFPETIRTNRYYTDKYADQIADAQKRALFTTSRSSPQCAFDEEMWPYLPDPFRGTVERRVLGANETALSLELDVSRQVLHAARISATDIGLIISSSLMPDQPGIGNGAYLAKTLGTRRPAVNLESTTSSSLVALQMACACVSSGQYDSVLVVTSCTYSRCSDEADPQTWFLGDGASAFVVHPTDGGGFLAAETINSAETCDAIYCRLAAGKEARIVMTSTPQGGQILRDTAELYLKACCHGALRKAHLAVDDVDFFVFATPTAWFSKFASRVLSISDEKTIDEYQKYANVGSVLVPGNLHAAVRQHRIKQGDLVLMFSIGCVSTASAVLFRWGETIV